MTSDGTFVFVRPIDPWGLLPSAPLFEAIDGYFYGTTSLGGQGSGTVFRTTADGQLNSFDLHIPIGATPLSPVVQGTDGRLYGTTLESCTASPSLSGSVFAMRPSGTFTGMHTFTGTPDDGACPESGVIQATDGNFYGTTRLGGVSDLGTVFQITPDGVLTILYSFSRADGAEPWAELIQTSDGNFYGTTSNGGDSDGGTIFQMTPDGIVTVLHSLTGADGRFPRAPLMEASDGNLYGTTTDGGGGGRGTVFQLTPDGTVTVVYSFSGGPDDGAVPNGLIQATDGNLYGTTRQGGQANSGVVFRLSLPTAIPSQHSARK